MHEPHDPRVWKRTMAPRLAALAALFAICVVAVGARLVQLQILDRPFYETKSENQKDRTETLFAPRGDIVDRNGRILAMSVDAETVVAEAFKFKDKDPGKVAAALCRALGDCAGSDEATMRAQLAKGRGYPWLRRQIDDARAERVAALKIDGISFKKEPHRWYPNRELAGQVLGFVGADHKGLDGLERLYDSLLRGSDGNVMLERGGGKTPRPFSRVVTPAVPGKTLELTIDANLQCIAERELRAAVEENRAKGGSIIVLEPWTGEILAEASWPFVNANEWSRASDDEKMNRPVQLTYEPGSTFKIVTATAALDGKVWSPDDPVDTGNGVFRIGSRVIDEAHGVAYGTLSFTNVLVKSSNIGAVLIGRRVGATLLRDYIERFGFGTRLSPDFPSESGGLYSSSDSWNDSRLASRSMGYDIGVTALQLAVATSAVANGGELVQPRVVRAVIDANGRQVVPRKVLRRVMTPETAETLTTIMEAVVDHGTATRAQVRNFVAAGKTGTSNKNENKHYIEEYNTSFVGFVPSRTPALTIVVHIDTPRGPNKPFGGTVAAPVFSRVAEAALRYLGVPSTVNPAPPVLVAKREAPAPLPVALPAAPVTIVPALAPVSAGQVVLPDLRGMGGREAVRVLASIGIMPRPAGDGVVIEQDPPPGTPVDFGSSCRLWLARANPGLAP